MNRHSNAFSLIEACVAVAIVLVVWLTEFSVFSSVRQGLSLTENHFNAAVIGKSLIDEINGTSFDDIVASAGTKTITGTDNGAPFYRTISYTVNMSALSANKKRVWVTMTWRESSGNKQVVLETLVTR